MKLFTWTDINDPEWNWEEIRLKNRSDHKKEIISHLDKKIIWQLPVKIAIVKALENSGNMLIDRKWPIGKFLFYWPSGTGKTSIVQELAWMLFNDTKWYTHIACENLNASHQTANLFWSPPWYVWFQKKTILSPDTVFAPYNKAKAQRQLPLPSIDSIILFDEVEKMHPAISQSLLSVLDEWIVNLMDWTKTDLSRALIFFTSNIGEKEINNRKPIWFNSQSISKESIRESAVRKHFSPEFMARIDDMFEFQSLWWDDRMRILKDVSYAKLVEDIGYYTPWISINISDDVYQHIIDGAEWKTVRELKRWFEEIRLRLWMIISTNNLEDKKLAINIKIEWDKIIYTFKK